MSSGNGGEGDRAPIGPMQLAQRNSRRILPRRFYKRAAAHEAEGGHQVRVDGKPVRTPKGNVLATSDPALAQALAAEWEAQGEFVDPATMPLTRLINSAVDGVAERTAEVRDEIVRYAGSDLLSYRADAPAGLRAAQDDAWNPVLDWLKEELGAELLVTTGLTHRPQPAEALEAVARAIEGLDAPRLAALHSATTLTGSAGLALAVLHRRLTAAEAWTAAHVDEDWQVRLWGADHEASQRRERRWLEMQAAGLVLTAGSSRP